MALIYTLSNKADSIGKKEIHIRFKSGTFAARGKSGISIFPDWFNYVIGKTTDTPLKNKRLITPEMEQVQEYHQQIKIKFAELIKLIETETKTADKTNSDWLLMVIDKFINPEKYNPKLTKPDITNLFQFVKYFIETAPERKDKQTGRLLTYNNIQQYKATEKHLKAFAKSIKRKDFDFEEINQKFYDKFVKFLQEKDFTQNSVGKHIRILKLMLNEATIQGFNTSTYYNTFHVFTEETDSVYLSEAELQQLKDKNLSDSPHLERVRDWFLLLAWTGCRFSDLTKIAKTDIKDGFITFRQQKTNNKVTIPLHPVVLEVLEKYNFSLPEEISNQKFNDYIKEACKLAELNSKEQITITRGGVLKTETLPKYELISSHTGRRSFATNMYKRGLPTLMIMSITGHKTEKSFLKYIKVKQEEHAQMMADKWKEIYK